MKVLKSNWALSLKAHNVRVLEPSKPSDRNTFALSQKVFKEMTHIFVTQCCVRTLFCTHASLDLWILLYFWLRIAMLGYCFLCAYLPGIIIFCLRNVVLGYCLVQTYLPGCVIFIVYFWLCDVVLGLYFVQTYFPGWLILLLYFLLRNFVLGRCFGYAMLF